MRILFVTSLPPERSSFVGRTLPLARALHRAGHKVEILTLSGKTQPPFTETIDVGAGVIRVVGPNLRPTAVPLPPFRTTWQRLRAGRRALADALTAQRADVVVLAKPQLQNIGPAIAFAARARTPVFLDADDFEPAASRFPALVRWFMVALDRRAARAATVVTACSPWLVTHYQRLNPRARVELLPTGINVPTDIPPARLRERLHLPADATIILYVGSLSIASGHRADALLEAFSGLHETYPARGPHLVLAGDGLDVGKLQSMARELGPAAQRIHFLGRFTPPEDLALAREVTLLVDPVDASPPNEAKSSHRVLLALATGTPIVAGRVGIRKLLLPPTSHPWCLYDPARPGDLAEKLAAALHPSCRARFETETAGCIKSWTWSTLGKQFVTLVESTAPPR